MLEPDVPFSAPWHVQLFAMTVAMNEAGLFGWGDWAARFGRELEDVATEGNDAYYAAWLRAFEDFLVEQGHASEASLRELPAAWQEAARLTPLGQPIELGAARGTV